MKKTIENLVLDGERALYGSKGVKLVNVKFDGPQDGESALKESADIEAVNCFCNLRYPFWHVRGLKINDSEMTGLCRAALWYSENVGIKDTLMHGIKAVRECKNVSLSGCDIVSPEFGWSTDGLTMENCSADSVYFLMRAENVSLKNVQFSGKYSFQYTENVTVEGGKLDTKDAFWHAKNVVVKDCYVKGEYLGWYSDGLTFINCTIEGTQPFCYCKNLKLSGCKMIGCDLAFEKSEAEAELTAPLISVKNFYSGKIIVPSIREIIRDDPQAKGEIVFCAE